MIWDLQCHASPAHQGHPKTAPAFLVALLRVANQKPQYHCDYMKTLPFCVI